MKALQPPTIAPPFARYAHGVELPAGARIIRTSGQLGMTRDGTVPEGAQAQAELCFASITEILKAGGMAPSDIFHLSAYVIDRSHMPGYMAARDGYLVGRSVLPSSTLVIVSGFTRPEFVVEIEAWAAAV